MLRSETNSKNWRSHPFTDCLYMYGSAINTVNYDKTASSVLNQVYVAIYVFPVWQVFAEVIQNFGYNCKWVTSAKTNML